MPGSSAATTRQLPRRRVWIPGGRCCRARPRDGEDPRGRHHEGDPALPGRRGLDCTRRAPRTAPSGRARSRARAERAQLATRQRAASARRSRAASDGERSTVPGHGPSAKAPKRAAGVRRSGGPAFRRDLGRSLIRRCRETASATRPRTATAICPRTALGADPLTTATPARSRHRVRIIYGNTSMGRVRHSCFTVLQTRQQKDVMLLPPAVEAPSVAGDTRSADRGVARKSKRVDCAPVRLRALLALIKRVPRRHEMTRLQPAPRRRGTAIASFTHQHAGAPRASDSDAREARPQEGVRSGELLCVLLSLVLSSALVTRGRRRATDRPARLPIRTSEICALPGVTVTAPPPRPDANGR